MKFTGQTTWRQALALAFVFINGTNSGFADPVSSKPLSDPQITHLTVISEGPQKTITLPLRIFIINDIELEKKKVKMTTWVTPEQLQKSIVPEINRIWAPAGIQWVIESIIVQPAADMKNRAETITYIQNSKREAKDAKVKIYGKRPQKINSLCGKKNQHPVIHNLYLFPYLGQTFQGYARIGGNYAVIGAWTDKHTRGSKPPEKALLTEGLPMKRGSIARTCAHELGHNLGLLHPDKKTQKQLNRIMGGRKQGYSLTAEEIKTARKIALSRAHKILSKKLPTAP